MKFQPTRAGFLYGNRTAEFEAMRRIVAVLIRPGNRRRLRPNSLLNCLSRRQYRKKLCPGRYVGHRRKVWATAASLAVVVALIAGLLLFQRSPTPAVADVKVDLRLTGSGDDVFINWNQASKEVRDSSRGHWRSSMAMHQRLLCPWMKLP